MSVRDTSKSFLAWAALSLTIVMACGGPVAVDSNHPSTEAAAGATTPAGSTTPTGSQTPGGPAATSAIFDTPEPIDVGVALDTDKMVEALIPVDGGSITTTGSDGTVYTLDVPSDALNNETAIGMTPVGSLSGMPFGGTQTYAVQFSPEGLQLQNFAVLTIKPAVEIPADQQTFFSYLGNGKDLIFAWPVADSSELKINVLHFSGDGVTNGTPAKVDPLRERLGGDAERRLQSWSAQKLGIERQLQLMGGSESFGPELIKEFAEATQLFDEQVVKPRVAAAGESCAAGKLALQTVLGVERQRQLMGGKDALYDKYPGLVDKVARTCVLEEFTACGQYHRVWLMQSIYEGMVQQQSRFPIYSAGTLAEARDLTIKCLTFRLEFESTAKDKRPGLYTYASSVKAKVMLRYAPSANPPGFIGGNGVFDNTKYKITVPGCTTTTTLGGGEIAVLNVMFHVVAGAPDSDGNYPDAHVQDLTMNYMPASSSEHAMNSCNGTPPQPMALPAWSLAYLGTHDEWMTGTGLVAEQWDVSEGALFAEKEWNLKKGTFTDESTMKLYHVLGG